MYPETHFRTLLFKNFHRAAQTLTFTREEWVRGFAFRFDFSFLSSTCWIVFSAVIMILPKKYWCSTTPTPLYLCPITIFQLFLHVCCMVINQQELFPQVFEHRFPTLDLFHGHHTVIQNFSLCDLSLSLPLSLLFSLN